MLGEELLTDILMTGFVLFTAGVYTAVETVKTISGPAIVIGTYGLIGFLDAWDAIHDP